MGGFDDYALADGPAVGPTGAVSWARHTATGQAVAVTELDAAVAADEAFLGRLRATAAALTKVGHPNVLPIREVVEGDGRVWVVEDWVDGRELGEILGDGRLTAEQSVALTDGVLRALVAVHGKGVVHGDVSTASIVVAADGVPRLVGFGFNGLPGRPPADADADVLAAAVVLRDLLAGGARHPKLEAVVERATSARPKDRPKNAAALLALVEKAARSDFGKGWEAKPSLAQRAAAAPVEATEELVGPARATLAAPLPPVADPTGRVGRVGRAGRLSGRVGRGGRGGRIGGTGRSQCLRRGRHRDRTGAGRARWASRRRDRRPGGRGRAGPPRSGRHRDRRGGAGRARGCSRRSDSRGRRRDQRFRTDGVGSFRRVRPGVG